MPGWQGSNRRQELPKNWSAIRARVLKRDGGQCVARHPDTGVRCDEPATDVDHIKPGDYHNESNLRSLCGWHHKKKSSSEGGAARIAIQRRNAKKFDRSEPHPGELSL